MTRPAEWCCGNCCWWEKEDDEMGVCRRMPPIMLSTGLPGDRFVSFFAQSRADAWCGEFTSDPPWEKKVWPEKCDKCGEAFEKGERVSVSGVGGYYHYDCFPFRGMGGEPEGFVLDRHRQLVELDARWDDMCYGEPSPPGVVYHPDHPIICVNPNHDHG